MDKLKRLTVIIFVLLIFASGCSTSGLSVRGYLQETERVDLQMDGNSGYIMGTPQVKEVENKTREVFVIEVTKSVSSLPDKYYGIEKVEHTTEKIYRSASSQEVQKAPDIVPEIALPSFTDESFTIDEGTSDPGQIETYTVRKEDNLQKISKKFYGSFRKWPKIYEANKDVLKTPDVVNEGTVLKIPIE